MNTIDSDASAAMGAVVFLYNHEAGHQLWHTIGILRELAQRDYDFPLVCAVSNEDIARAAREALGGAADRVQFFNMALPPVLSAVTRLGNRLVPAERLARLQWHAGALRHAKLIVAPERTCLFLKRKWKGQGPRFIYIPHGSGDRNVSYHPAKGQFDHILVSGQKVADEMIASNLIEPGKIKVIGYPKFDMVDREVRPDFFGNDRPCFVYNPHFDPYLSSWYDHGHDIINWFAKGEGREFNLIFAPHVMLFRKKLHISPEYRMARRRPDLDPAWQRCPNILLDTGSSRLFDMSYTLGSDAYIGDVSSQVYEFLLRPRPVYFIDTHGKAESGKPYLAWDAGVRVKNAAELAAHLPKFRDHSLTYLERQKEVLNYTFSVTDMPASRVAAEWLHTLMSQ